MGALKLLLISALALCLVCLGLAVYHWTRLSRDRKRSDKDVVSQRPVWLEFPRAYTNQGRRHQRRFFVYLVVFVLLFIMLFALHQVGTGSA